MDINFSSSWDIETLQNKTYDEETSITMMCPKCFNVHRIPFDEISEKHKTKIKKINKYRKKGYIKPFYYNDDIVDFFEPEIITRGKCDYCKEMTEFIIMDEKIADVVSIFNNKGYFTSFSCEGHIIKKNRGSIPYIAFKTEDINKYKDYIPFGWVIERKSLDFLNPVIIRGHFEPFDDDDYGNHEHQIILDDLIDFANSLPNNYHNNFGMKYCIESFDKFIVTADYLIGKITEKNKVVNCLDNLYFLYFYLSSELIEYYRILRSQEIKKDYKKDIDSLRKFMVYRLKQLFMKYKTKRNEMKDIEVLFIKYYRVIEKCFSEPYEPSFIVERIIHSCLFDSSIINLYYEE